MAARYVGPCSARRPRPRGSPPAGRTGDVLREPLGQLPAVRGGRLAETEERPDLSAVIFDRPPLPVVAEVLLGSDPDLPGDVGHDAARDVLLSPGEAALVDEVLEEHGETETDVRALVAEEHQLVG